MLGVARHEREALGRTIQSTDPAAWVLPAGSGRWRCRDVMAHLASTEVAAAAVLAGEAPTELEEYLKSEEGADPTLDGFSRFAVERRAQVPVRQVILEWGRAADLFLSRASLVTPGDWETRRVPWVAGEIPLRYLIQSRIAEWWSHGEDVRAGAELEPRREHWPMYAANDLAIRALPWALGLAGLSFPGRSVLFELESAGGGQAPRRQRGRTGVPVRAGGQPAGARGAVPGRRHAGGGGRRGPGPNRAPEPSLLRIAAQGGRRRHLSPGDLLRRRHRHRHHAADPGRPRPACPHRDVVRPRPGPAVAQLRRLHGQLPDRRHHVGEPPPHVQADRAGRPPLPDLQRDLPDDHRRGAVHHRAG